jgi:hypothetical protein
MTTEGSGKGSQAICGPAAEPRFAVPYRVGGRKSKIRNPKSEIQLFGITIHRMMYTRAPGKATERMDPTT